MGKRMTMEWAARGEHMSGIPRKLAITSVGVGAKLITTLFNNTSLHNTDTLLDLVRSRPPGVPLLTVSNHMSTLDDPLMWGFKGFPITDPKLSRWVLAAEDICFKDKLLSYFFRIANSFDMALRNCRLVVEINGLVGDLYSGIVAKLANYWGRNVGVLDMVFEREPGNGNLSGKVAVNGCCSSPF